MIMHFTKIRPMIPNRLGFGTWDLGFKKKAELEVQPFF
jgi:hypothetical protein